MAETTSSSERGLVDTAHPSFRALQLGRNNGTPDFCFSALQPNNALSPVTDLALNLTGLTTHSTLTPKRRISWSSDTPTNCFSISNVSTSSDSSSGADTPSFENRLLRDVTLEKASNQLQQGSRGKLCCVGANLSNTPTSSLQPGDPNNWKSLMTKSALRRIRSLPSRALCHKPVEKENIPERSQTNESGDIEDKNSLYLGCNETSPTVAPHLRPFSKRLSAFGDFVASDSDSQDSGCILSSCDDRTNSISAASSLLSICEESELRSSFIEPCQFAPRKCKLSECSSKCPTSDDAFPFTSRRFSSSSFPSSGLADVEDNAGDFDGFDLFGQTDQNDNEKDSLLNDLFTGTINGDSFTSPNSIEIEPFSASLSPPVQPRVSVRRSLSMVASLDCSPMYISEKEQQENKSFGDSHNLLLSRKRLLNRDDAVIAFKRPDPPGESGSLLESKRRKSVTTLVAARRPSDSQLSILSPLVESNQGGNRKVLAQRSYSVNDIRIDTALRRSEQEKNLRGDYSGCNVLPVLEGRHPDLKTISCDTLLQLVNGDFKDSVQCYTIIDCRYPYEYDGGHIVGAQNLFTKDAIIQQFLPESEMSKLRNDEENFSEKRLETTRRVLIFHCEFSSERGPKLYRFLRKEDRQANKDNYPFLFYPEIYLLEGGYKEFFTKHKELCEPQQYKPMSHKDHRQDLNHFRAKSKSWNGDSKSRVTFRSGLKL